MGRLRDKQTEFARAVPRLIDAAFVLGYEVTLGDCFRDARCAYGSSKTLHRKRLAFDLNLFKDGKYLRQSKDYKKLGRYWESIGGKWGVIRDGEQVDGNHFEWPE